MFKIRTFKLNDDSNSNIKEKLSLEKILDYIKDGTIISVELEMANDNEIIKIEKKLIDFKSNTHFILTKKDTYEMIYKFDELKKKVKELIKKSLSTSIQIQNDVGQTKEKTVNLVYNNTSEPPQIISEQNDSVQQLPTDVGQTKEKTVNLVYTSEPPQIISEQTDSVQQLPTDVGQTKEKTVNLVYNTTIESPQIISEQTDSVQQLQTDIGQTKEKTVNLVYNTTIEPPQS